MKDLSLPAASAVIVLTCLRSVELPLQRVMVTGCEKHTVSCLPVFISLGQGAYRVTAVRPLHRGWLPGSEFVRPFAKGDGLGCRAELQEANSGSEASVGEVHGSCVRDMNDADK